MTSILMTLLISFAPANADMFVRVNNGISENAEYCRLVITRDRVEMNNEITAVGDLSMYCRSEYVEVGSKADEKDLVFRYSGTAVNDGIIIDLLDEKAVAIRQLLTSKQFQDTPLSCEPTKFVKGTEAYIYKPGVDAEKAQMTKVAMPPAGAIRVCHYYRRR